MYFIQLLKTSDIIQWHTLLKIKTLIESILITHLVLR